MNEDRYIEMLIKAQRLDEMLQERRRLEAQLTAIEIEKADLQAENHRLSARVKETSGHGRRVRRAKRIAQLMILLHTSGLPHSRRYMIENGLCRQRQWERAVALLRLARIYSRHSFVIDDAALLQRRLDRACEIALDNPLALKARMPRH